MLISLWFWLSEDGEYHRFIDFGGSCQYSNNPLATIKPPQKPVDFWMHTTYFQNVHHLNHQTWLIVTTNATYQKLSDYFALIIRWADDALIHICPSFSQEFCFPTLPSLRLTSDQMLNILDIKGYVSRQTNWKVWGWKTFCLWRIKDVSNFLIHWWKLQDLRLFPSLSWSDENSFYQVAASLDCTQWPWFVGWR